jgi:predicted small metal-binding protein
MDNNNEAGLFDDLVMHVEKAHSMLELLNLEALHKSDLSVKHSFIASLKDEIVKVREVLIELLKDGKVDSSLGYMESWMSAAQKEAEYQHEIAILKAENRALREGFTKDR